MRHLISLLSLAALLGGCGGGGGGGEPIVSNPASTTDWYTRAQPVSTAAARIEAYDRLVSRLLVQARRAELAASPSVRPFQVRLAALPSLPDAGLSDPASLGGLVPKARQIGAGRALPGLDSPAALQSRLSWQPLPGGGMGAALRIQSDGAQALRMALDVEQLPPSAVLRVFATGAGPAVEMSGAEVLAGASGPRTGRAAALTWLPTVSGADATLEILLPAGVDPASVQLSVPMVSHLWVDLLSPRGAIVAKAASTCNLDGCPAGLADQARSVAQVTFSDPAAGGASFLCTGTLLADTDRTGIPYLLTARHCISSQGAASTVETYWFKTAAPCDALMPSAPQRASALGAQLLHASADTDVSFLRLLGTPPDGVRYAGTLLAAAPVGTPVGVLHHPAGDVLKFSQGEVRGTATCVGNPAQGTVECSTGDRFLEVGWRAGITEQGSSGSALFTPVGGQNYVTGQLYAGRASCAVPTGTDYFGRIDIAYRARLSQWLGPVRGAGCPTCPP